MFRLALRVAVEHGLCGAGPADPAHRRNVGADDLGAGCPQRLNHLAHHQRRARRQLAVIEIVRRVGGVAWQADPRALQSVLVEDRRVVRRAPQALGRRIERVAGREHIEQDRRVAHGAGQRTGGILAVRNGDDAGAADEAHGRLDRDEPVLRRRVEQRARCFGADRRRAQPGSDRDRRTRARTARRHDRHAHVVERRRVGVLHLPAQRAVAGRHVDRDEIGEFGQIRLSKDHGASGAQPAHDGRILLGPCRLEGKGTGGRVLAVGGRDVVLDQDRDAGERVALRRLLAVTRSCDGERVRVDLAHRVEAQPGAVIGRDAGEIGLRQRG